MSLQGRAAWCIRVKCSILLRAPPPLSMYLKHTNSQTHTHFLSPHLIGPTVSEITGNDGKRDPIENKVFLEQISVHKNSQSFLDSSEPMVLFL